MGCCSATPRGLFIVVEGLDRSGKSTLCHKLQTLLKGSKVLKFPDRECPYTGDSISLMLQGETKMSPAERHVMFSDNRRYAQDKLKALLHAGFHVIADRYVHSGLAYAKVEGIEVTHLQAEMVKPDLVIYLKADPVVLAKREGYGKELFEKLNVQRAVGENFSQYFEHHNDPFQFSHLNVEADKQSSHAIAISIMSDIRDRFFTWSASTDNFGESVVWKLKALPELEML